MKLVAATKLNSLWQKELDELKSKHPDLQVSATGDPAAPEVAEADIILGAHLSEELLRNAKNLKAAACPVAGVNHLPLQLLAEKGVSLANAHANARYVAERTLALTLGFFGKLVPYHEDLRNEKWHGFAVGESVLESWESLVGMRVAILGAGAIGGWIARLFSIFDCTIVGYRRSDVAPEPPYNEMTTNITEAVTAADVVICVLPLTDETRGVLDKRVFDAMEGALFVNVGRGAVADEKALYHALESGTLRGAAIDTWYNYPGTGEKSGAPANHPIHKLPNVLLSPHLGGYTPKAVAASVREIFEKTDFYLREGRFPEEVDLSKQY
jgi:phosphoglycerate dehydrogenase-like enzyme